VKVASSSRTGTLRARLFPAVQQEVEGELSGARPLVYRRWTRPPLRSIRLRGKEPERSDKRAPHRWIDAHVRDVDSFLGHLAAPVAGGLVAAVMASGKMAGAETGVLAFLAFAWGCSIAARWEAPYAPLAGSIRVLARLIGALLGSLFIGVSQAITGLPGLSLGALLLASAATAAVNTLPGTLLRFYWKARHDVRIGIIGSPRSASNMAQELELREIKGFDVAGWITTDDAREHQEGDYPVLGDLSELSQVVDEHDLNLLLIANGTPRLTVFDKVARSFLQEPVRLLELNAFYEQMFGRVLVTDINNAWFQHLMHPRYRSSAPRMKRVLDLAIAIPVGILFLPVLAGLALILRREGTVFFKQVRIGEGGRLFTMYKLRTMEVGASSAWSSADDPRVTRIGRILRRAHLDELPQLINVIKGEMSLVGPRPEQPDFVDHLETLVPFYQRRHLVKPGITGWAQLCCGYAGSDEGSAWKVCHDLYYLKHRSMPFDVMILLHTLGKLVLHSHHAGMTGVPFLLDATSQEIG
jgi:exopolysaccharide biosynthesis polyprenyl glycosylphosphotransferase